MHAVRMAQQVQVPAMTLVAVPSSTSARGLVQTESGPVVLFCHELRIANGIHGVVSELPFQILVANLMAKSRTPQRGTVIAYAKRNPLQLLAHDDEMTHSIDAELMFRNILPATGERVQSRKESSPISLSIEYDKCNPSLDEGSIIAID